MNAIWQLDHADAAPLHRQFEQRVKEHIHSRIWKPGDKIPSERDLMALAGISRATVRQALERLVNQGVLEKAHGRGTYVRQPKFEQPLHLVYSFYEQLRSAGVRLTSEVVKVDLIPASAALAGQLMLLPGHPVLEVVRRRFIKDTPVMICITYLNNDLCSELVNDDLTQSFYYLLTQKYQLPVLRAVDRFEAMPADNAMAAQLNVARRFPLMFVERTAYTTDDAVLHVGLSYIRGDMCRFRSEMRSSMPSLELKPLDSAEESETSYA